MTPLVERLGSQQSTGVEQTMSAAETAPKRIDVTDLDAAGVAEFVESKVDTERVSLENRGARTYLVVGE